jgi:hypothetical protein
MRRDHSIPGVLRFIGAGLYTSVPVELPAALRDQVVIVAGATEEAVSAVERLASWCRTVTYVKPGGTPIAALRGLKNVTVVGGAEIVCVDGIGQLECVVVRKISGGQVTAYGAVALFLLE